jgi:hypothetical protein
MGQKKVTISVSVVTENVLAQAGCSEEIAGFCKKPRLTY